MEYDVIQVVNFFMRRKGTLMNVKKSLLKNIADVLDNSLNNKDFSKKELITTIQSNINNIGWTNNPRLNNLFTLYGIQKSKDRNMWFFNKIKADHTFAVKFFFIILNDTEKKYYNMIKKGIKQFHNETITPVQSRIQSYKHSVKRYIIDLLKSKSA